MLLFSRPNETFLGCVDPEKSILMMKIITFGGDVTDVPDETKALSLTVPAIWCTVSPLSIQTKVFFSTGLRSDAE